LEAKAKGCAEGAARGSVTRDANAISYRPYNKVVVVATEGHRLKVGWLNRSYRKDALCGACKHAQWVYRAVTYYRVLRERVNDVLKAQVCPGSGVFAVAVGSDLCVDVCQQSWY
jgi:hypothetical protein